MTEPEFRIVESEQGEAVTYDCGCPCEPTARPSDSGAAGSEHCCCGKVHFVGTGAEEQLTLYLAERKAMRQREPDYVRGTTTVMLQRGVTPVAWAFPRE